MLHPPIWLLCACKERERVFPFFPRLAALCIVLLRRFEILLGEHTEGTLNMKCCVHSNVFQENPHILAPNPIQLWANEAFKLREEEKKACNFFKLKKSRHVFCRTTSHQRNYAFFLLIGHNCTWLRWARTL